MSQYADDTRIGSLPLPFTFEVETAEGVAEARICKTPEFRYFRDAGTKPFFYSVHMLNVWGDIGGSYTLGDIRREIF